MQARAGAGAAAVLLLLLCVAGRGLAQGPWEKTVTGTLRGAGDYASHHLADVPVLLEPGMRFEITTDPKCEIVLCWTNLIKAPKEYQEWGDKMCEVYQVWDQQVGTFTSKKTRPGEAHLNLFCTTAGGCDYTVKMSGTECPPGSYGDTCKGVEALPLEDFPIPKTEWILFNMSLNHHWSSNWLNVSITEKGGRAFSFFMREGDAPRAPNERGEPGVYDQGQVFTGHGTISIANPRSVGPDVEETFQYIFFVGNQNDETIEITMEEREGHCEHWLHDIDCSETAPPLISGITYQIPNTKKTWEYGSVTIIDGDKDRDYFSVGVTALEAQEAPAFYLRYGNIPTSDQYDMKLGWDSNTTRFYNSGRTNVRSGRWFFGAHIARSSQEGAFGLWFQDDCPNGCSLHGECVSHECQCEDGYRGNWFTCAAADPSSDASSSGGGGGGGISGTYIFFIVMFCIETLLILVLAVGAGYWFVTRKSGYEAF